MGLIKGSVNLTRYRVLDSPSEVTEEFVAERLQNNAFIYIDNTLDEESLGWVEVLNPFAMDFQPTSFNFGESYVMGMRVDTRKISPKVVQRYLSIAIADAEARTQRPLSVDERRELKLKVRTELMSRTPVNTDVYEVCWFVKKEEIWLAGTGTKLRERLEDLWHRTFGLGIVMKIPYILARDLAPEDAPPDSVDRIQASALFGGARS